MKQTRFPLTGVLIRIGVASVLVAVSVGFVLYSHSRDAVRHYKIRHPVPKPVLQY